MSLSAKGFSHGLCRDCDDFSDSHALHALAERVTIDRVTVVDEIGRRGIVWEGVDDLLGDPLGGGGVRAQDASNASPNSGKRRSGNVKNLSMPQLSGGDA